MDITPLIPEGRQIVEAYGDGRFRISGVVYEGSVIVFPQQTQAWPLAEVQALSLDDLTAVFEASQAVDVLLLGCGRSGTLIPKALRDAVRARGVALEAMDTGAAARTFNVLMSEDRRVAAALIAVD
jgi:uncharacterized protein